MKNNGNFFKRVFAFVLDFLIVSIILLILTKFLPENIQYEESLKKISDAQIKYINKEIEREEFDNIYNEENYKINKSNYSRLIIEVGVIILYYVVLTYLWNGLTLGKKMMKIRIIDKDSKSLSINRLFIRCLYIDFGLQKTILLVLIFILSKEKYITYSSTIDSVFSFLYLASITIMLFREDGRGLHDILCNTKVISEKENIIEGKIEEKKV